MATIEALTFDIEKDGWENSRGFTKREIPMPALDEKTAPQDAISVIVKVQFAGVCGTDRGIWNRAVFKDWIHDSLKREGKTMRIVGHEFTGSVVRAGSMVQTLYDIKVGDSVSGDSHVTCGKCFQCRIGEGHVCTNDQILGVSIDGIFAPYVKIPAKNLWVVDLKRVRPEVAAMYDPFGNAIHATTETDFRGQRVAVFGCGPIGMFSILLLRVFGAAKIIAIDTNAQNLETAKELGAHETILIQEKAKAHAFDADPEVISRIMELTYGKGVDISIEMAGPNSSVNNCLESTRRGGKVILFGLKDGDFAVPKFAKSIQKGLTIHGIIGRKIFENWQTAQRILSDKSNGIQDKIFNIILKGGNGTIIPFEEYTPELFETQLKEHAKILFKFSDAVLPSILKKEMASIKAQGLYKEERIISSPQGREISVGEKRLLNFCANNYLGLANNEDLKAAAKASLGQWGFGLSSVRFICGTQEIHKTLEQKVAQFVGTEDAILYSSGFDANTGLFQTILNEEDAVITDSLNHASIIDGIRLCKAERFIYQHMDMKDLEEKLKLTQEKRLRLIATDGVFSMDGDIAPLNEICALAKKHNALVMVDDAHATGFVGATGRGTHEYHNVMGQVDFITSTFGKALGGASGGFMAAKKEIIDFFRQRSRTYLFSNSLSPVVTDVSIAAIDYVQLHPELRQRLWENTKLFRSKMQERGFTIPASEHPIVPIMIGDATIAKNMAKDLFDLGMYVVAFSYPVVPEGTARIRVQISAAHATQDIEKAVELFTQTAKEYSLI